MTTSVCMRSINIFRPSEFELELTNFDGDSRIQCRFNKCTGQMGGNQNIPESQFNATQTSELAFARKVITGLDRALAILRDKFRDDKQQLHARRNLFGYSYEVWDGDIGYSISIEDSFRDDGVADDVSVTYLDESSACYIGEIFIKPGYLLAQGILIQRMWDYAVQQNPSPDRNGNKFKELGRIYHQPQRTGEPEEL